jgi:hypothetical protein
MTARHAWRAHLLLTAETDHHTMPCVTDEFRSGSALCILPTSLTGIVSRAARAAAFRGVFSQGCIVAVLRSKLRTIQKCQAGRIYRLCWRTLTWRNLYVVHWHTVQVSASKGIRARPQSLASAVKTRPLPAEQHTGPTSSSHRK